MSEATGLWKHLASLSFVVQMLVIVLPVWWKTTEVYRASLPYSEIENLHSLPLVQKSNILLVTIDAEDSHVRGPAFQNVLKQSKIFDISLTVRTPHEDEMKIMEDSKDLRIIDEKIGSRLMQGNPGSLAFLEVPPGLFSEVPHIVIGNQRTVYYSSFVPSEQLAAVAVDSLLGEPRMLSLIRKLTSSSSNRPAPSESSRKRTTGHLDIFLSLLIPQPEFVMASWDISEATKQFLDPFLAGFPLDFKVRSQVVYLTPLNIPAADHSGGAELTPAQLGLAVNTVESVLASQSSSHPGLNMMVYLPPVQSSPLTISQSATDSFLLPRWGGVHVYNYLTKDQQNVKFPLNIELDMERVMGIWVGQLRSLLGVEEVKDYEVLPVPSSGIRQWEQDFQLRYRGLENILDSKSTLSSLAHLLSQIPNIVISEDIGEIVHSSVANIIRGSEELKLGNLQRSYTHSRKALELSEEAFFDKSLLELLYFPDDQKYAIYIPYFLPVGFAVILSLKSLFQFFKDEMKKTKID